jgi:hypothetical protein
MENKVIATVIVLASVLTVGTLTTIYTQQAFAVIRPNPTPGSPAGGLCLTGPVCGGNAGNGGLGGNGGTCTTSGCVRNGESAFGGTGGNSNGAQGQNGGNGGVGANGGNGGVGANGGNGANG